MPRRDQPSRIFLLLFLLVCIFSCSVVVLFSSFPLAKYTARSSFSVSTTILPGKSSTGDTTVAFKRNLRKGTHSFVDKLRGLHDAKTTEIEKLISDAEDWTFSFYRAKDDLKRKCTFYAKRQSLSHLTRPTLDAEEGGQQPYIFQGQRQHNGHVREGSTFDSPEPSISTFNGTATISLPQRCVGHTRMYSRARRDFNFKSSEIALPALSSVELRLNGQIWTLCENSVATDFELLERARIPPYMNAVANSRDKDTHSAQVMTVIVVEDLTPDWLHSVKYSKIRGLLRDLPNEFVSLMHNAVFLPFDNAAANYMSFVAGKQLDMVVSPNDASTLLGYRVSDKDKINTRQLFTSSVSSGFVVPQPSTSSVTNILTSLGVCPLGYGNCKSPSLDVVAEIVPSFVALNLGVQPTVRREDDFLFSFYKQFEKALLQSNTLECNVSSLHAIDGRTSSTIRSATPWLKVRGRSGIPVGQLSPRKAAKARQQVFREVQQNTDTLKRCSYSRLPQKAGIVFVYISNFPQSELTLNVAIEESLRRHSPTLVVGIGHGENRKPANRPSTGFQQERRFAGGLWLLPKDLHMPAVVPTDVVSLCDLQATIDKLMRKSMFTHTCGSPVDEKREIATLPYDCELSKE